MALTKPLIPVDESPLTYEVMAAIFRNTPPDFVLAGGQALAFWMERYEVGVARHAQSDFNAMVTTDADFLSAAPAQALRSAGRMAQSMNGRLLTPDRRALTSLVTQIRLHAGSGLEHNIDVLTLLFDAGGLKASNDLTRRALGRVVEIELDGGITLRILHPLDVLASRINNTARLSVAKGGHTVTQARWGVRVAYRAIEQAALNPGAKAERPGALAQEVMRLSSGTAGRAVRANFGIDAAAAIPFETLSEHVKGFATQGARMIAALKRQERWPLAAAVKSSRRRTTTTPAATNKSRGK